MRAQDPALRTISLDFVRTLLANLHKLEIDETLILTTRKMCVRVLQSQHGLYNCAWSSLWTEHPGLPKWSLAAGDMFLLWAQQWRYIARALELGYSVRARRASCCGGRGAVPRLFLVAVVVLPKGSACPVAAFVRRCSGRTRTYTSPSAPSGSSAAHFSPPLASSSSRYSQVTPKLPPSYFLQVTAMRQTLF